MSSRRTTYQQAITPNTLIDCISQTEWRDSGKSHDEMTEAIQNCVGDLLNEGTYSFSIKAQDDLFINAHNSHSIDALCQDLILRKISKTIKQIYYIKPGNRNRIVKHIITLLNEKCDLWILRLDVHHFYDTIDRGKILSDLKARGRLSAQTIMLLEKLFQTEEIRVSNGLPRGLNVSAMLSELYMKYFDIELKKQNGVYYYARYVDDIIIFCTTKQAREEAYQRVVEELSKLSLTLNDEKTIFWDQTQAYPFIYLGYAFNKKGDTVTTTIAPEKLRKIKTRITRSFVRFAKDGNYDDLLMRIKYLTGNFRLKQLNRILPITVGLYYNYRYINEYTCLTELQMYYEKVLNVKRGKLGRQISRFLTKTQRKTLQKYNFVFGFRKRVRYSFNKDMLNKIRSCWR